MNFTRLKLYHFPATRSVRVKWLLHELLDDDFDVEVVPLYDCAQYRPEYLEKNPNHNVPALEFTLDNGERRVMLESNANALAAASSSFPVRVATRPRQTGKGYRRMSTKRPPRLRRSSDPWV